MLHNVYAEYPMSQSFGFQLLSLDSNSLLLHLLLLLSKVIFLYKDDSK